MRNIVFGLLIYGWALPLLAQEVPNEFSRNEGVVSAPRILEPLVECTETITVSGLIPDYEVWLSYNGTQFRQDTQIADYLGQAQFKVPPGVNYRANTRVQAFHLVDGVTVTSSQARVQSVADAYPNGLPAPELKQLWVCGRSLNSWGQPPGVRLDLLQTPIDTGVQDYATSSSGNPHIFWLWGRNVPQKDGDEYIAEYQMCGMPKVVSQPRQARDYQGAIPPARVANVHHGERTLEIWDYVQGTLVTVETESGELLYRNTFSEGSFVRINLNRPVDMYSDRLIVKQELCSGQNSTVGPIDVLPCNEMPSPELQQPRAGDTEVYVQNAQPGAIISVFDARGNTIGYGTGDVIVLTRALVAGDEIFVTQKSGNCESETARYYFVTLPFSEEEFGASLELTSVIASGNRRPAIWDPRARDVSFNPMGPPIRLETNNVPGAQMGPVMLGKAINAFALWDDEANGIIERLGVDCQRNGQWVDGTAPVFGLNVPNSVLQELCTGRQYGTLINGAQANLILLFEFVATAGGTQQTQFFALQFRVDNNNILQPIVANAGDIHPGYGFAGQVMYSVDTNAFGRYQIQPGSALPANGRPGVLQGSFDNTVLRGLIPQLTFVAEVFSTLRGSFYIPVYND